MSAPICLSTLEKILTADAGGWVKLHELSDGSKAIGVDVDWITLTGEEAALVAELMAKEPA